MEPKASEGWKMYVSGQDWAVWEKVPLELTPGNGNGNSSSNGNGNGNGNGSGNGS